MSTNGFAYNALLDRIFAVKDPADFSAIEQEIGSAKLAAQERIRECDRLTETIVGRFTSVKAAHQEEWDKEQARAKAALDARR